MARRRLKVFFDGGCRPNPGPIEAAVVVRGVAHLFDDLGVGTNSDAEWLALIRALELSQSLGLTGIELVGDALAVIREADRTLRISQAAQGHTAQGPVAQGPVAQGPVAQGPVAQGPVAQAHAATFLALAAKAPPARIRWIKREQNLAGIALAARHPR